MDVDDDGEEFQPPVVPKNAVSRVHPSGIRHEDLFAHLQPEQCKMIVAAMSRAEYSEGDTIKKDDISNTYVLELDSAR